MDNSRITIIAMSTSKSLGTSATGDHNNKIFLLTSAVQNNRSDKIHKNDGHKAISEQAFAMAIHTDHRVNSPLADYKNWHQFLASLETINYKRDLLTCYDDFLLPFLLK